MYTILITILASSSLYSASNITGQEEEVTFKMAGGINSLYNWDYPVWRWTYSGWMADMFPGEFLVDYGIDIPVNIDTARSELALVETMTVEYFPEEMNGAGFINSGGISAIEIDLREGVTFHDGSQWNASACKFNFDRYYIITGNLTGTITSADTVLTADGYPKVDDHLMYFTENWNLSDVVTPQYYGKDNNADLSYTTVGDTGIAQNRFPNLNKTLVVTPGGVNGGGRVRFEFNMWYTGLAAIDYFPMISMETYQDYIDTPIYGFGDAPGFIQDYEGTGDGFRHFVCTGPYEYVSMDNIVANQIVMKKYENWWNATAMEANGYNIIDNLIVQMFTSTGLALEQAITTSCLAGDLDFAWDQTWGPLDRDPFIDNPNWGYTQTNLGNGIGELCFNWLTTTPSLRKAFCYAFDYDAMINNALKGYAERTPYIIENNDQYYNGDIPHPYHNLTIARQTLLDDPTYGPALTAAGLTAGTDANQNFLWRVFADTTDNDNFTFNYFYDITSQRFTDVFIDSIKDIGFSINSSSNWALTGTLSTFIAFWYGMWDDGLQQGCWLEFNSPNIGFLESYYGQDEFWNWGNVYNATINDLIYGLKMKNETETQKDVDEIVYWAANVEYPWMYIYQNYNGFAISNEYDCVFVTEYFHPEYVSIATEGPTGPPAIPGYSSMLISVFSLVGVLALIFSIKRKK